MSGAEEGGMEGSERNGSGRRRGNNATAFKGWLCCGRPAVSWIGASPALGWRLWWRARECGAHADDSLLR